MILTTSKLAITILYNLIGYRSRKELFIAIIAVYVAIRIHFKRYNLQKKQKLKRLQKLKRIRIKDKPLITFSGGGQLGFYFQGICAYLRDNFDLDNVRFAGISAGSAASASLACKMSTEATMVFGLKWFRLISDRALKLFLIQPSQFCNVGSDICDQFGITDDWITEQNERTDLYYGVTSFSEWPPRHELISGFTGRQDTFYAMSCSMRVLPFFTTPGYYRKMWMLDGGFSAIFSIPKDCNPDKVIKITPSSRIDADVQPNYYSKHCFQVIDAFKMPSLDFIYQQFENGYMDAIRCRPKLIAKGLKVKDGGCYNNLKQHMDMLRKHGQNFFYNENPDELRKQDFSHFLPEISPKPRSV